MTTALKKTLRPRRRTTRKTSVPRKNQVAATTPARKQYSPRLPVEQRLKEKRPVRGKGCKGTPCGVSMSRITWLNPPKPRPVAAARAAGVNDKSNAPAKTAAHQPNQCVVPR